MLGSLDQRLKVIYNTDIFGTALKTECLGYFFVIPIKKISGVPGTPPLVFPIMTHIFPQRSGGATLGRPKGRHFGDL